jgi:capsular polysaccharide transport system permease protein
VTQVSGSNGPKGLLASLKKNRLFVAVVVIPTLIAAVYFGLVASDVYISESRFIVRAPERQATAGLGALLQTSGISTFIRATDDIYAVHDFMLSRDALNHLDKALGLRAAFSNVEIDRFSRFPRLDFDDSFEALHRYYQQRVQLSLDSQSSISTLRAEAFSAELALGINKLLLEAAERLVNDLNERARQDMIRFASAEVATAEARAKDAALAVSRFRTKRGVIDPERQTTLQLQLISKLQDELIATKTQIAQLKQFTPDNPQLKSLQLKARTLEAEMKAELSGVAGGDTSLAAKAADYQRLALEREFADRQLAGALASLEQARNEAQRKQLYLERIAQPSLPDVAVEPRRIRGFFATFVLSLIAWGILSMLIAGIREHQD